MTVLPHIPYAAKMRQFGEVYDPIVLGNIFANPLLTTPHART